MEQFVLAIDQGTTGTTVTLFNRNSEMVGKVYEEFTQHYPKPGWVEHDAQEIWASQLATLRNLRQKLPPAHIKSAQNAINSIAIATSAISVPASGPIIWQPKTRSVFLSAGWDFYS